MKMRYGKHPIRIVALTVCVLALSWTQAAAVFDPWADHKMHYPQLPDAFGWDVHMTGVGSVVADDWLCSATGAVSNIYFWGSWFNGYPGMLTHVNVAIYSDNPMGQMGWSEPAELLWSRIFTAGEFEIVLTEFGEQGYLMPVEGGVFPFDHVIYHQVSITDIPDPFVQQQGTVYWLGLSVLADPEWPWFGWKTSLDHWNDDAVYLLPDLNNTYQVNNLAPHWWELRDPITTESLDMAFVITPEPATMALLGLGLGAVALLRRK